MGYFFPGLGHREADATDSFEVIFHNAPWSRANHSKVTSDE
jgi:hypothetical protein